jgi:hypothetical protein
LVRAVERQSFQRYGTTGPILPLHRALFIAGFDDRAALEINNFIRPHHVRTTDKFAAKRSEFSLAIFVQSSHVAARSRMFVRMPELICYQSFCA